VRSFQCRLAVAAVAIASLFAVGSAQAAAFTVSSTDDLGPGTLRQAITDANAAGGPDTITITATGTITLATPLPSLTDAVEIAGPGASQLSVDANDTGAVFAVNGGVAATIHDLTATNGTSGGTGGAIFVAGTLTLNDAIVSNSVAATDGGGIEIVGGGRLDATRITVSGNAANLSLNGTGGGINVESGATLTLRESTVSGNQSRTNAGGVRVQGTATIQKSTINGNMALGGFAGGIGITSVFEGGAGSLTLENSTVTDNSATINAGGVGGFGNVDIVSSTIASNSAPTGANLTSSGAMSVRNSILAYPVTPVGAATPANNCSTSGGTLTSLGHNIDDGATPGSCTFTASGDQVGVDPKLGALVDNGGPTLTRAPADDSPAVNHGTAAGLVAEANGRVTDQRGVIRPVSTDADIGAVELAPPTAITGGFSNVTSSGASVSGTVTNPHVEAGQAFFQYGPEGNPTQSHTDAVTVPAGANNVPESADLANLQPSTTYHYRLVVNNQEGSSTGEDRTFTTSAAPQPPTPNPPTPNPPTPTPTPPDNPASVLISHRRLPLVKGRIKVVLVCLGAKGKRCKGSLVLAATDRKTRFRMARRVAEPSRSFNFKAGAKLTLQMRLPDKTRDQLKNSHHAVVRATATLTSGGPQSSRLLTINRH
jgi:hypothetical protein